MQSMKKGPSFNPGGRPLKPVELQYSFVVKDRQGQTRAFDVNIDLIDGAPDLAVTFRGRDDEMSLLPAELFESVREALALVAARVKPDDLVERDD